MPHRYSHKSKPPSMSSSNQIARISVALGVVMASGIILTVVTYILLQNFLGGMINRKISAHHQHLVTVITKKSDEMSKKMDLFSFLTVRDSGFESLNNYLAQLRLTRQSLGFDQILWINRDPSDQRIKIDQLLFMREESDRRIMAVIQNQLLRQLSNLRLPSSGSLSGQVFSLPIQVPFAAQTDQISTDHNNFVLRYGYVALVLPLRQPNDEGGYLVGVLPFRNLVDDPDLDAIGSNFLLSVDWHGSIFEAYPGRWEGTQAPDQIDPAAPFMTGDVKIWNDPAVIKLQMASDHEQEIMFMIPNLILMIGVILTIFGGLYVRNNQKQAIMLTKMNKTLALKNMEMNSQVTERERLNQILRKTEQEKRAIMDSVSDIIFEVDQNGRLLFLNEAWYRITGFPVEQSKGLNLFDVMEPRLREMNRKIFDQILVGQKVSTAFSVGILVAGETYRQMQVRYSMIRMDENNNPRIVGSMTDIEEFQRAESALLEAEEKYRTIWEHAVTGIYQVSLEGQMISANPALARIFGYATPSDMVEAVTMMNRQLYASPKDRQVVINRLVEEGQVSAIESQGIRRDRSHFWMVESARVVRDSEGQILYLEGSIDDITERKAAELRLKSAMMELELANRSKAEFLANMSHELRTPLNAIIGFSEIIRDEVFGRFEQRQYHDYARDIHESGKNLLNIINTILDVSRIEAGERQLNETVIQLPLLIGNLIELVRPRIDENMQTLQLNLPPKLPRLWAEELAIKQILLNLVTNSIKFTPSNGLITIAVEVDAGGDLRLMVSDTGVGLDSDEIERVMAPFGQASGSLSRSSSGPGLGLTLVNALTRLHGGHFEMVSQKGVGTTATVILPSSRLQI